MVIDLASGSDCSSDTDTASETEGMWSKLYLKFNKLWNKIYTMMKKLQWTLILKVKRGPTKTLTLINEKNTALLD